MKIKDYVLTPHGDIGILIEIKDLLWGFKHQVKIVQGALYDVGEIVSFKETDLTVIDYKSEYAALILPDYQAVRRRNYNEY